MVFKIENVIQNKIIILNIIILSIGVYLSWIYKNPIYLSLVFVVFIINEILYYSIGLDIYPSHSRTELCYSSASINSVISDELNNVNTNFTEGHFKNDKCIPWQESEKNRFEHFIEILEIQPGDYVLDAGCGFGGLVKYFRERGINAYGITITKEQYEQNKVNVGDFFYYGDYTVFNSNLLNKFDYIIFPGSLEHPFGGNPSMMKTYVHKYEKMKKMFELMKHYFRKDSKKRKILTTTLHGNVKYKNTYQAFVTERMFGGTYPLINKYSVADSLRDVGYKIQMKKDYTWHYYYVSYCNLSHFGNPVDIGLKVLPLSIFYPHIIYAYIYWKYGYWMWMFDGKNHSIRKTEVCDPSKGCDLTYEKDINKRPVTLFYTIGQL